MSFCACCLASLFLASGFNSFSVYIIGGVDQFNHLSGKLLWYGIPLVDQHKFQIFAAVACDILWLYRNKAYHDGNSYDTISVSNHINKITLEHFQA
jgi:hypothetical protein